VLGRLLVTPFGHPVQCFVRFDIGDLAEAAPEQVCPCGQRAGLTLARIAGRVSDLTMTRDGRRVTVADVDEVLAEVPEARGFQIDQQPDGALHVRLCLGPRAGSDAVRDAERRLERVYRYPVVAEGVTALEHEPSGKVRLARRLG